MLRKLGPGAYLDEADGALHVEIHELLTMHGFPDTKANRDVFEAAAIEVAEAAGMEWKIVEHGKVTKKGGGTT